MSPSLAINAKSAKENSTGEDARSLQSHTLSRDIDYGRDMERRAKWFVIRVLTAFVDALRFGRGKTNARFKRTRSDPNARTDRRTVPTE